MSKRKGASKNQQTHFSSYEGGLKAQANRTKRLVKHCKAFPEDKQAKASLKKGLAEYRRYSPKGKTWTATNRYYAQLYVKAGLNGNEALPKKVTSKA